MKKWMPIPVFAIIVVLFAYIFLYPAPMENEIVEVREVVVDCSKEIGVIRNIYGTMNGPKPLAGTYMEKYEANFYKNFKDMAIRYVRFNDLHGPCDMDNIFPDFAKDTSSPENYNFSLTDEYVKAVIDVGAEIFFRFGYSYSPTPYNPPENFEKWVDICNHVVAHYNEGWNNGFHFNITYWEFLTEITGFPCLHWNGTFEEYCVLYETLAKTLKREYPYIKIGAPAQTGVTNLRVGPEEELFIDKFLKYCKDNDVPLDFFSWHSFGSYPYKRVELANFVQNKLYEYSLNNTENVISAWSIYGSGKHEENENEVGTAFTASVLAYLQDTPVKIAIRYKALGHNMYPLIQNLFDTDGTLKKPALAFRAFTMLLNTPLRIYCSGSDKYGFATIAGISHDEDAITILISNYDSEYDGYKLIVQNLPWKGETFTYKRSLVDENHALDIIEQQTLSGASLIKTIDLNGNSIHVIRLEK